MPQIKRCCVFAHYDPDDLLDPYVIAYLRALSPHVDKTVLVSTSQLSAESQLELSHMGVQTICRKNIGYDFYSWKVGIESIDLDQYDELLQINDSCYAPLFEFDEVFAHMNKIKCDFWGITKSYYFSKHLQSYFVCYRKPVIGDVIFRQFWQSLEEIHNKRQLIKTYEAGIGKLLRLNGFHMETYFKLTIFEYIRTLPRNIRQKMRATKNLNPYKYLRHIALSNPTAHYYQEMLDRKIPVIKVGLIRGQPCSSPLIDLHGIESINHDTLELIEAHQARSGSSHSPSVADT